MFNISVYSVKSNLFFKYPNRTGIYFDFIQKIKLTEFSKHDKTEPKFYN